MNTYSYANQNGVRFYDPMGLAYSPRGEHGPSGEMTIEEFYQLIIPQTACEWRCWGSTLTCFKDIVANPYADLVCSIVAYKVCVANFCEDEECE